MIDKKMRSNFSAGMNVDAGPTMRPLGHDSRQKRHFFVKQMRHSINGNSFKGGVGENNLFVTFRGGIALVGGIDIGPEYFSDFGQWRHEKRENAFSFFLRGVACGIIAETFAN